MDQLKITKTERNSNIELLRIILMLMVILLHFNNGEMGGAFNYTSDLKINDFILHLFESLSICAVNCFMIISGYFLAFNNKVKLNRIIDLFLVVIFYNYFDFFLTMIVNHQSFSIKSFILCLLPANYFAILYSVTYLLSPYIVKIFDSIDKKQQNILIIILLIIFTITSTIIDFLNNLFNSDYFNRGSTISGNGDLNGYSIVQFIIAFIIGIWLRRRSIKIKNSFLIIFYIISSLIMTVLSKRIPSVYAYSTIFSLFNSILLFLIFNNFQFKNKLINFLSKSVFPIFCIHTCGSVLYLWRQYFIKSEYLSGNVFKLFLCVIISIITMFIFSLFIDIISKGLFSKIKIFICNKMPVIVNLDKISIEKNNE